MVSIRIFLRHNLDFQFPAWIVCTLNRFKQILLMTFTIVTDYFCGFFVGQVLNSLQTFKMKFHPETFVIGINKTIGMTAKAVHMSIAFR